MMFRGAILLSAACFVFACSALAGETCRVQVVCDKPQFVAGNDLRVLVFDRQFNAFRALRGHKWVFDDQGRCEVDLPPDRYRFETYSSDVERVVAVRCDPVDITHDATVSLRALDPVPLTFYADKDEVTIDVIAVRTAATEHVHNWRADGKPPSIVISPGETYSVGVLGRRDDNYYACWTKLRSEQRGRIVFDARRIYRAAFHWRDGSPLRDTSQPGRLGLFFPGTDWQIDVAPGAAPRLFTNRRFLEIAYSYPTTAGGRFYFERHGHILGADSTVEIGGPVSHYAWLAIHHRRIDTGYDDHLRSGAWLADPDDRMLDTAASNVPLTDRLVRVDGGELPANPLSDQAKAALGSLADNFRVEVAYQLDEPVEVMLQPRTTYQMRSQHFVMQAIPGWEWRCIAYLNKAERAYATLEPISAYPGSGTVNIGWLTNDHRARGGWHGKRTGKKNGHINMPFRTVRDQAGFFSPVSFLSHEVAHTYGYPHGDDMNRTVDEGHRRFLEFTWYVVDHPDYIPNPVPR